MARLKITVEGELVVELYSGKSLSAPELAELDVNWHFFHRFVHIIKNVLAELPKMPGWSEIQEKLPHTTHGGACDWRDVVIILLVAPFLTNNNIAAMYRLLEGSSALCAVLGLATVPSRGRISHYKNHLLGGPCFVRVRLKLAFRLKRQGGLGLKKLVIDGAPLFARANLRKLSMKKNTPYEVIQRTFSATNLTWLDYYYPLRVWNQTPTSTILICYLLMYWLGMRCLAAFHGWLKKHPEIFPLVGLTEPLISVGALQNFRGRFKRYVQETHGTNAPFQTVEDLVLAVCADLRANGPLAEILRLDELQTNEFLFNLFRFRQRVSDPDAMTGYCHARRTHFLGYRVILIVDAETKLPLFGCIFPGNREEGSVARDVLDQLVQAFTLLDGLDLPRAATLFADSAYDEASVTAWACQSGIRLVIVSETLAPRHTARWARRHRIRVEQGLSDLTEVLGLSQLRTTTLPYVQIFTEVILTARLAQGVVAFEDGRPEKVPCPTYPAFGR